jgi:hypothetical protein
MVFYVVKDFFKFDIIFYPEVPIPLRYKQYKKRYDYYTKTDQEGEEDISTEEQSDVNLILTGKKRYIKDNKN